MLVSFPIDHDATSFYRGMGPLALLQKQVDSLRLITTENYKWSTMIPADVFFMQRPFKPQHLEMLQMAKSKRMPVWVDYDDHLLQVPTDNPTHPMYTDPKIQASLIGILKEADMVSVSTNFLATCLAPLNKNIRVINNALNTQWFNDLRNIDLRKDDRDVVMWRGSSTHQRDVMSVARQLKDLSNTPELASWKWHFIGANMWFITDAMPHNNTFWCDAMDIFVYHQHIVELAPRVAIVPLYDNPFNRCKSNIAWIEATLAGAVTIAPDWEEWKRPGVLNYKTADDFRRILYQVLTGEISKESTDRMVNESWEDIQKNYNCETTNHKRIEILDELFTKLPKVAKIHKDW